MGEKGSLLIIDDRPNMLKMLSNLLKDHFEIVTCDGGAKGLAAFKKEPTDLVLTDIRMPDVSGMDVLRGVKKESPPTEVILMTAYAEVQQAVEALKAGAYDYIIKPFEPDEMVLALEKALERKRLRERTEVLQREVEGKFGFASIVGESKVMERAVEMARKAAASDATVLLTGESGTGKEVFARAIHYASPRNKKRFVAINCAAMPKELIESELFGHVKGAFSGASKDKHGLFEQADGGTLLLDEISELPLEMQAKINRAIQEREVRRVGDTVERPVDVRIIASTNCDLTKAMEDGHFREDLYFRLNVFPLDLPPLREREGDIPLLVSHFLNQIAGDKAANCRVTPEAMQRLSGYWWPGNVRELRNAMERAVLLCENETITADLFAFLGEGQAGEAAVGDVPVNLPYRDAMERMTLSCQREYLLALLKKCEGNVTKAAELANIERESFHRLMRKCGVRSEDIKRGMEPNP